MEYIIILEKGVYEQLVELSSMTKQDFDQELTKMVFLQLSEIQPRLCHRKYLTLCLLEDQLGSVNVCTLQ